MENKTVLQMNHIMKIYSNGVVANEDVSIELKRGKSMLCWERTAQEKVRL